MGDTGTPDLAPAEQRTANPDRLVFLSDGVIAIIITILVLDIKVPELGSGQAMAESLAEVGPTFISFVISFLLVGMFWTLHKKTFDQVRYIDHNSIWLNFLFLLALALVPYASSAVGEYSSEPAALHLYGVVLLAATLLRFWLDAYFQSHPGLLWVKNSKKSRRIASTLNSAMIVVYVAAMLAAGWNTSASLILYFSIPLLYFFAVAGLKADSRTQEDASDLD